MSYILDALRKAEAQRRQREQPAGIEPPLQTRPQRRRVPNLSIWIVASVVIALNAAALGFFWLRRAAPPLEVDRTAIPTQIGDRQLTLPGEARTSTPPLLSELPSSMRERLGPIKVNAHVHAGENSARSYAIINGERLRNGAKGAAGFRLLRIEPRQLILEYKRRRFRIVTVEDTP